MRVETIGNATLYLGDCREILPTISGIDSIVSDPPYGMAWDGRVKAGKNSDSPNTKRGNVRKIVGDDEPFNPEPFLAYRHVILWGSNHFAARLPRGTTLVWLKRLDAGFGSFLSDAEMAWLNRGHGIYAKRDLSLQVTSFERNHTNEKPVGIMEWCLGFAHDARLVCDPFMGSGTTGVACARLNLPFVGIEVDPVHYATAVRRIEAAQRQGDLLRGIQPRPKMETGDLLAGIPV